MAIARFGSPQPTHRRLSVIAQDPSIKGDDGKILRATVRVRRDRLDPGPRSHRFHVVDYDATAHELRQEAQVTESLPGLDPFSGLTNDQLEADPAFRAQHVYAIAERTLATFEAALGRRVPWAFGGPQLYLVPAAFAEANAYYDDDSQAVLFGYFTADDGRQVYTSLSHDIVAHELTHAILDGLRPDFGEPGLPDQLAFHEAFADIAALLSVFSTREVVEHFLGPIADPEGRIPAGRVAPEILRKSPLLGLAEQMGAATHAHRGDALRRSVDLEPFTTWVDDPAYDEPHLRGEILVAAVAHAFVGMWSDRLRALISEAQTLDRARAAEEGAKAADHLLRMTIRAVDYCPPLEFEYGDFLDALLTSDAEVTPDDEHGYRPRLRDAFEAFGIRQPEARIIDLSRAGPLDYEQLDFEELRSRRVEVARFIWRNAPPSAIGTGEERLSGIDTRYWLSVTSVEPSVRVGPDGLVVNEVVATYLQTTSGTAAELAALAATQGATLRLSAGLPEETQLRIDGGGALVFDQFGRAKFHQAKPLFDWPRQQRRLDFLWRNRLVDTRSRLGFSFGTPTGQRFAALHEPNVDPREAW